MKKRAPAGPLIDSARRLSEEVSKLRFAEPVAYVYNPLDYAWSLHEAYLRRFGRGKKRVLFLGMNPGPWGMAQTGVPFGEVAAVRDWMGLEGTVGSPSKPHPKRPIQGLACTRSEVSGARLWGWAQSRYESAEAFFSEKFVLNYCPLVFMEDSGRNRTPDKLPVSERGPLDAICDRGLAEAIDIFEPEWVIGVGVYAEKKAKAVIGNRAVKIGRILHPSPASPVANRGWAPQAEAQLQTLGID